MSSEPSESSERANTAQAQAWNGPEGVHWAAGQDRWNAVNEGFDAPLLDAAGIAAADRVLDLGCGAGQTTRRAALRAHRGHATGLDLSAPLLDAARAGAAAEAVGNVTFVAGDAQTHPFPPGSFDRAVSRYGVMFFAGPEAAFGNIGRALRPGGRLAFVCPAAPEDNEWVAAMAALGEHLPLGDFGRAGLPGMFSLADPERIKAVLDAAGFVRVAVAPVRAYGTWGTDATDAAGFLLTSGPGRHLMAQAAPHTREAAGRALVDHLRRHEGAGATTGRTVRLLSTSWLATAERPA
ncbi:class I SAM-dependent methyltransferase [Streptomyces sp. NPDC090025]|uniref:class I SAM-dependent methyltransferase n=1 Tax=Streptomyces sp. NPDC090025 TaxID=3365922 RepID=UPI00383666DD